MEHCVITEIFYLISHIHLPIILKVYLLDFTNNHGILLHILYIMAFVFSETTVEFASLHNQPKRKPVSTRETKIRKEIFHISRD